MPFVTEYNTSLILKAIVGDIPEDILEWEPYKKSIYFLNRMDKNTLRYFKEYCQNPNRNPNQVYKPFKKEDKKLFIYEGGYPAYHKYEFCEKLNANFTNFKIPEELRERGDDAVAEFREWFKKEHDKFLADPALYQARLLSKYNIYRSIERVEYENSGNRYQENLTLETIEIRIDSILQNAADYYNEDQGRQIVIRRFQRSTFLAFKPEDIKDIPPGFTEDKVRTILKEYFYLFVQPTIFYLKEHFRIFYGSTIEINEEIFTFLNFVQCKHCYDPNYILPKVDLSEKQKALEGRFGDYTFPIEPTVFVFKEFKETSLCIAFIYCFLFRNYEELLSDEFGVYKQYHAEFVNHHNKVIYVKTKVYESEWGAIRLFKRYITKIEKNTLTNFVQYTTYGIAL